MAVVSVGASVQLVLGESRAVSGQSAPWIGPLLALGARASRYAGRAPGRQLVVALSVPSRDFAAALVGCGWVLASEGPTLAAPLTTLRSLEPGVSVRAVNSNFVVAGSFVSLDETVTPARARFAGSYWQVNGIEALAAIERLDEPRKSARPEVGSIGKLAHVDSEWAARLAAPSADLAIVGTASWLDGDFDAWITRAGDSLTPSCIRDLLLPDLGPVATWFTRIYSSARLPEQLPLPADLRCVILDGFGAIKYLGEVEAPVVICILDRSVADDTAAEIVVQLRNTHGEPVLVQGDLGWRVPAGVEAVAFTVPR